MLSHVTKDFEVESSGLKNQRHTMAKRSLKKIIFCFKSQTPMIHNGVRTATGVETEGIVEVTEDEYVTDEIQWSQATLSVIGRGCVIMRL